MTVASAGSPCYLLGYILSRGHCPNKPRVISGHSLQISPQEFIISLGPHWGPIPDPEHSGQLPDAPQGCPLWSVCCRLFGFQYRNPKVSSLNCWLSTTEGKGCRLFSYPPDVSAVIKTIVSAWLWGFFPKK